MNISKYKKRITLRGCFHAFLMMAFTVWLTYPSMQEGRYTGAIFLVILSLAVWYFTYLFPSYQIESTQLRVRTINGEIYIEINSIQKIETHTHLLGLGMFMPIQKGLLIHYGNNKDVFVKPKEQDIFIQQLLAINPTIETVQKSGKEK